MKNCSRPPWAQRILYEIIQHLDYFPAPYRDELYRLINEIGKDPVAGKALFMVVMDRMEVMDACWKFNIPENKLRRMKEQFYSRYLDNIIRKR